MTHDERQEDIYITGCSELICEVFRHSQVFRIGGMSLLPSFRDLITITVML